MLCSFPVARKRELAHGLGARSGKRMRSTGFGTFGKKRRRLFLALTMPTSLLLALRACLSLIFVGLEASISMIRSRAASLSEIKLWPVRRRRRGHLFFGFSRLSSLSDGLAHAGRLGTRRAGLTIPSKLLA